MHILIAEDDTFLLRVYSAELQKAGYRVTSADDGEKVLAMAREEIPDLILLDILMPKKNGFEVLEEMRKDEKLAKTPVIVLTSLEREEDAKHAKKLGANDYFIKSDMDLDNLIFLIRTLAPPAKAAKKRHSNT